MTYFSLRRARAMNDEAAEYRISFNARNILMIEPVSAESQVGKLIKEAKAQEAKAQSK